MSPAPIPTVVPGFFDYEFHQVALFCPDGVEPAVNLWIDLGYSEWIVDHAELKGRLEKHPVSGGDNNEMEDVITKATMAFNYDIMPMELEFLHYSGPNRWMHTQMPNSSLDPFISHMSTYVDDVIEETQNLSRALGYAPYHRFITQNHTNPGVVGVKRFIESIFSTRNFLGYDIKLIQKVPWDYNDNDWLGLEI